MFWDWAVPASPRRSRARMIVYTTCCAGLPMPGALASLNWTRRKPPFEAIWQARGPAEHAFAADYRRLASRLIAALLKAGAGHRFRDAQPLAIDFPNGRVLVEPNELAELPDGTVVIRRVRTGYKRTGEYNRLEYTLYHLAAKSQFGGPCRCSGTAPYRRDH